MDSSSTVTILITGTSGFLASRIVQQLLRDHPEYHVIAVDARSRSATGQQHTQVTDVQLDITSRTAVESVMLQHRPDAVLHVAGLSPPLEERYRRRIEKEVFQVNVEGTRNVLRAALLAKVKAFIYTSSCCVVTDDLKKSYANIDERWPLVQPGKASIYGESKAAAETMVLQANGTTDQQDADGLRTCALRPSIIFGEGDQQFLPNIVNCILHKDESPFRLGDGTNLWDVVYVGNVADAHILALNNLLSSEPTAAGEAFFIQNNEPVSCRDLMLQIWKCFNGHIPRFQIEIPISWAWFAGVVLEQYSNLTGKPATISRGSVMDATATRYASGQKARQILGYEPRVDLEEGLRRSCLEYAKRLRTNGEIENLWSVGDHLPAKWSSRYDQE